MISPGRNMSLNYASACKSGKRRQRTPKPAAAGPQWKGDDHNQQGGGIKEEKCEAPQTTLPANDDWEMISPGNCAERWALVDDTPKPSLEPRNLQELMARQAQFHEDLVRDLVPFWLKAMEAFEQGEELKLEAYLEGIIAERKASGWYWSVSEADKQDQKERKNENAGDAWSNHKESDNGWGNGGQDADWSQPIRWEPPANRGRPEWGETGQQDRRDGWGSPKKAHDDRNNSLGNNAGDGWGQRDGRGSVKKADDKNNSWENNGGGGWGDSGNGWGGGNVAMEHRCDNVDNTLFKNNSSRGGPGQGGWGNAGNGWDQPQNAEKEQEGKWDTAKKREDQNGSWRRNNGQPNPHRGRGRGRGRR